MSRLYVSNAPGAGLAFEDLFVSTFDMLELRTTSGSGSVHGDGDARARHVDHDRLQFALEGKVRQSAKKRTMTPTAAEWRKAMGDPSRRPGSPDWKGQLRMYSPRAVRLFAVYNCNSNDYMVWVPDTDLQFHRVLADAPFSTVKTFRTRGVALEQAVGFSASEWADLAHKIAGVR